MKCFECLVERQKAREGVSELGNALIGALEKETGRGVVDAVTIHNGEALCGLHSAKAIDVRLFIETGRFKAKPIREKAMVTR